MKKKSGLTLIEIIISVAILAIGILALAHLFPIGLKSSERAGNFTRVSSYLQDTIEKLRYAASVYEPEDLNTSISPPMIEPNGDGKGYYELVYDYNDPGAKKNEKFTTYKDPQTGEKVGWSYLLLEEEPSLDTDIIQKAYVSIYWKTSGGIRADTTPIYITNPYYKEMGNVIP